MRQTPQAEQEHAGQPSTQGVESYLVSLRSACDASRAYLAADPKLSHACQLMEKFADLSVWPLVLNPPGSPPPAPDDPDHQAHRELSSDLQRALFFGKAGLYEEAGDRLRRFLRKCLWCAATANGAKLEQGCDAMSGLEALQAAPAFKEFDSALQVRARMVTWREAIKALPAIATGDAPIAFHQASFRRFLSCLHEAIDLAITCCACVKPQIVVQLANTDKFGGFVQWAGLMEPKQVVTVLAVLKPKTQAYLKNVCGSAPVVVAARDYIKGMPAMKTDEEFLALAMLWKRREAQHATPSSAAPHMELASKTA